MLEKISLIADVLVIFAICFLVGQAVWEMVQENQETNIVDQEMRPTGRTDKNGRPVYEGDVIEYHIVFPGEEDTFEKSKIVWDDEVCGFLCQEIDRPNVKFEMPSQDDFAKAIEVIGNRWGNFR